MAKKREELVLLPPQCEEEGVAAGTTWPVIAVKDSTSFSNRHAAEEALKQGRAERQEAIDEEGEKTMEDSLFFSPLEEKEVSEAPQPQAAKDSDNGIPVLTPPVIQEPKYSEKHVPVPSAPQVPQRKESDEQVPLSAPMEVLKEEKAEPSGAEVPSVQQVSGEDVPAAAVGEEEIEEVGGAPKEEKMPACKQEDKEEAAPEVAAAVPHVKEEPLLKKLTDHSRASRE